MTPAVLVLYDFYHRDKPFAFCGKPDWISRLKNPEVESWMDLNEKRKMEGAIVSMETYIFFFFGGCDCQYGNVDIYFTFPLQF